MSLQSDYELSVNFSFRGKVKIALCKVAMALLESRDHPEFKERLKLAQEILRNPEDFAAKFAAFLAADPAVDSTTNDNQLLERVKETVTRFL